MPPPEPEPLLHLALFGAPTLVAGGVRHALAWQRPSGLVAYLAAQPGWVSRDALAAWLRPDADAETAKGYVRRLLFRARQEPFGAGLEADAQRVRWAGSSDVRDFLAACDAGRWGDAVALATAPLAEGVGTLGEPGIDDWLDAERQRLRDRLRAALIAHVELLIAGGDRTGVAALLQRLVDTDPLDEDGVQFALTRAGNEIEQRIALAAFDTLQRRLAYEMALRPLPATQQAAAALRARAFDAPPLPTAAPAVPEAELAPFVGRAAELAAIAARFAGGARLVTLLGPGGVGKTRLARAALAQAGAPEVDGVRFVDLAAADDVASAEAALLAGLGVPDGSGSRHTRLRDWLAGRRLRVVLDNCEQLVEVCGALIAELVAAAPAVQWLATSREPFGIAAEHRLELGGLDFEGGSSAAAELFALHARRHGYAPTAAEAASIARIARAVEGLPLALELAAPWVGVMPPEEIATLIERDLGVLADAAPDRRSGHRSLRAVFDASWQRLSEAERSALAGLTVFRGSFERVAALQVLAVDPDLLLRLVGRSLLRRVDSRRFALHVQVAQFSAATLAPARAAVLRQRHARHYLERLAAEGGLQLGSQSAPAMTWIARDFDNLRAAWHAAVEAGAADLLQRARPAWEGYLFGARRFGEAAALFDAAVAALPATAPGRLRLQFAALHAAIADGQLDRGESGLAALVDALAPAALPPAERAELHTLHALLHNLRGRFDAQREASLAAAQAAAASGEQRLVARALLNLAATHAAHDDTAAADAAATGAIAAATSAGADTYRARAQRLLAVVRKDQGRLDEAQALLEACRAYFVALGDPFEVAYSDRELSYLAGLRGAHAEQLALAQRALAANEAQGARVAIAQSLLAVGIAERAQGLPHQAAASLRRCLALALELGLRAMQACALIELAALEAERGDRRSGLAWLVFALADPSVRARDRSHYGAHLARLRATEAELAGARNAMTGLALTDVARLALSGMSLQRD